MRTKRLHRWVAGLFAAAALGIGALSAAEIIYAQDMTWGATMSMVKSDPSHNS